MLDVSSKINIILLLRSEKIVVILVSDLSLIVAECIFVGIEEVIRIFGSELSIVFIARIDNV